MSYNPAFPSQYQMVGRTWKIILLSVKIKDSVDVEIFKLLLMRQLMAIARKCAELAYCNFA